MSENTIFQGSPTEASEVQEKRRAMEAKGDKPFCPLTKRECTCECVCYRKAQAVRTEEKQWEIFPGRCDNAMFMEHTIES